MNCIETISICLGVLSFLLAIWSIYLALEIKKKRKYWKRINFINNHLQENFGTLKNDLKERLKTASTNKSHQLKKINYDLEIEKRIEQNNDNINILLECINEILIDDYKRVNLIFNEALEKEIEDVIHFLTNTYSTTTNYILGTFYKNSSLIEKGLLCFVDDDYLNKEKFDKKKLEKEKEAEKERKLKKEKAWKINSIFELESMNEYILGFSNNSKDIFWTENLMFNNKEEQNKFCDYFNRSCDNYYEQKINYKIEKKYIFITYKKMINLTMRFSEIVNSRKGFSNWIKYYIFSTWKPKQD